jgi:hypothetical protein
VCVYVGACSVCSLLRKSISPPFHFTLLYASFHLLFASSFSCLHSILGTLQPGVSISLVHDDTKDKAFELELAWVCEESKNKYQRVPEELHAEALKSAEVTMDDMDNEDDFE